MGRIQVVEDNAHNLHLMTFMLQASGHSVISAITGDEGLDRARANHPDLVVLDVQLPDMDGKLVGDREKALAAGFDGYLSEPIDPTTFPGAMDRFLPVAARGPAPRRQWGPPEQPDPGGDEP
jgi:CheY-like chemotaxis protein